MGTRGLFDRIGTAPENRSGPSTKRSKRFLVDSIRAHLESLLNCTQGDCLTAPDYGVVDLTDLLRDLPDSIGLLRQTLQRTIERYEPRLKSVRVRFLPGAAGGDPTRLRFEISARLRETPSTQIRMTTQIAPGSHIFVE